jgi:hypothetical protein
MQKRTYLILLIVGAVLALIAVVFFFLRPFGDGTPATQPTPPPSGVPQTPFNPAAPPTFESPTGVAPDINDPAEQERQAQEALKRQAMSYAGRVGSHSSVDGFISIRQVYTESTEPLRERLESERQSLVATYPSFGPNYGKTTRSLSAFIASSEPIFTGTFALVEVQAQVVTNDTNGTETITYEKIAITFTRSNGEWLAAEIERESIQL